MVGNHLIKGWNKAGLKHYCFADLRQCFASYFTKSDIEDFKRIAQQYANYSESPLVVKKPRRNVAKSGPAKTAIDALASCRMPYKDGASAANPTLMIPTRVAMARVIMS